MEFNFEVPEIKKDTKTVNLKVGTDGVDGFDDKAKVVAEATGHLTSAMNGLAKGNATEAKSIFDANEGVEIVESNLNFGGAELNVTTHRSYQEDAGTVVQYFTQGQLVTGVAAEIMEATAGVFSSEEDAE